MPKLKDGNLYTVEQGVQQITAKMGKIFPEDMSIEDRVDTMALNADTILEELSRDPVEYEHVYKTSELDKLFRQINPDYRPLSGKQVKEKQELRSLMQKKFAKFSAERAMVTFIANGEDGLDRTQSLLYTHKLDEQSVEHNREVHDIMKNGTFEDKGQVYLTKLVELAELEIPDIDFTDDKSIVDNFEKVTEVMAVGAEIVNFYKTCQGTYGISFDSEEGRALRAKVGALSDMGYVLRNKIDLICSSTYDQINYEDIPRDFTIDNINYAKDDPDVEYVSMEEYLRDHSDVPHNRHTDAELTNVVMMNALFGGNPIFDKSIPVGERLQRVEQVYNDPSYKGEFDLYSPEKIQAGLDEQARKVQVAEDKRIQQQTEELLHGGVEMGEFTEEGFVQSEREERRQELQEAEDMFAGIDEAMEALKEEEIAETEAEKARVKAEGERNVAEFDEMMDTIGDAMAAIGQEEIEEEAQRVQEVNERLEHFKAEGNMHDFYKLKFTENLRVIQSVIPDFHMTDEEIEAYITPEQIALHDKALAKKEEFDVARDIVHKRGVVKSFVRCSFALMDTSGTPEAEKANETLLRILTSPDDKEFKQERKDLVLEVLNAVKDLDPSGLAKDVPLSQKIDYSIEHASILEAGMESENMLKSAGASMGFTFGLPFQQNVKNVRDKGVALGGGARAVLELSRSEEFLTMPFDKLTTDQWAMLIGAKGMPDDLRQKFTTCLSYTNQMDTYDDMMAYTEPSKEEITADQIIDVDLTIDKTKDKFTQLYQGLKNADNWYNFNNSSEYKSMVAAVKNVCQVLNSVDPSLPPEDVKKIREGMAAVDKTAKAYVDAKKGQPINENRQARLDIAKELLLYADELMSDDEVRRMGENTLKADAAEYYAGVREEMSKKTPQEAMFERGLGVTEVLRHEAETMPAGLSKTAMEMVVRSRDELSNFVGKSRADIDIVKVRDMLAMNIVCNQLAKLGANDPSKSREDNLDIIKFSVNKLRHDKAFNLAVRNFDSDKINDFLANDGEHTLVRDFVDKSKKIETETDKMEMATMTEMKDMGPSVG